MGTTAQKLEYLGTTKSQLKDMINYGLDDNNKITSSTTFRNYVSSIFNAFLEALRTPDTLFTNLPKKSGTGANITLNDTANAPMRIELGASELTQVGTTGANLQKYDVRTDSSNGISYSCDSTGQVKTTGTATATATFSLNFRATNGMSLSAGTYTLKVIGTKASNTVIIADSNELTLNANQEATINVPSSTTTFYVQVRCTTGSNTNDFYITLASGTTATTERYTGGIASPNPQYPQDIHTISGSNKVVVNGANFIDIYNAGLQSPSANSTYLMAGEYYVYVFSSTTTEYNCYLAYSSSKNGTYTFFNTTGTEYGSVDQRMQWYVRKSKLTLLKNAWVGLDIQDNDNTCVMITKDSTYYSSVPNGFRKDTSFMGDTIFNVLYEPYTSQEADIDLDTIEYCKIGNYEDKFIRTSGKNLFDISAATNEYLFTKTDNVFTSSSLSAYAVPKIKLGNSINVKNGQDYYISYDIKVDSGDLKNLNYFGRLSDTSSLTSFTNFGSLVGSFTISNQYQRVVWKTSATSDFIANYLFMQTTSPITNAQTISIKNIQISTENIDYEPYGTNEWYIKKNIGKVVLDGTQNIPIANWRASETSVGWVYGYNVFNSATISSTSVGAIMCDKLPAKSFAVLFDKTEDTGIALYTNTDYGLAVRTTDTSLTTTTAINNYLSNNPFKVYYPLATPTYTQITGTLANQLENVYKKMMSQKGQTNISQVNNDLAFNISASAIEEL